MNGITMWRLFVGTSACDIGDDPDQGVIDASLPARTIDLKSYKRWGKRIFTGIDGTLWGTTPEIVFASSGKTSLNGLALGKFPWYIPGLSETAFISALE